MDFEYETPQNDVNQTIILEETTSQSSTSHEETDKTAPKKNRTGLIILLVLCCISLVGGIINWVQQKKAPSQEVLKITSSMPFTSSTKDNFKKHQEHIAVIHIEGTIQKSNETYNQEWLISTIQELTHNEKNKGLLLYIDSPGGGVYESDEVYLELLDYKKESEKPVWAYLGPLAASGGYYIACAADYIVANRNCLTGSIGVIAGQSVDFSQFLENHGIKVQTFTAGSNKDMLGISTPVTPEQAEIMQSIADDCYNQFIGIVADSRNLTLQQVRNLADGRIYTARQASNNGLVDKIATYEEVCNLYEDALKKEQIEFVHFYPEKEFQFASYLFNSIKSFAQELTASSPESLLLEAKKQVLPEISYPAYFFQQ